MMTIKKQHLCNAKGGCIAVVEAEGDLCPAHYDACSLCGHPRRMHPVVQIVKMDEASGPVVRCYEFQHQGMKQSEASR